MSNKVNVKNLKAANRVAEAAGFYTRGMLATELGRSYLAVSQKIRELGIKRVGKVETADTRNGHAFEVFDDKALVKLKKALKPKPKQGWALILD